MLFLTNFLIVVGVMAALVAYLSGVVALAEYACDKWGAKGPISVVGVCIVLPMMILHALAMTYGS